MTETKAHLAVPESPTVRSTRPATALGRLAHALREQNWVAVAIEVLVVVVGVFVGMQVNNWNERRKQDQRFLFGLRGLHADIRAASFLAGSLADKTSYHLVVIDSLLRHPDAVVPERVPALFYLLDNYAFSEYDFDQAGLDRSLAYLEFDPDDEARNRMADDLRRFMDVPHDWAQSREEVGLEFVMTDHLQRHDIPVRFYTQGFGYAKYIAWCASEGYTPDQLVRAAALLRDPAVIADLMTLRTYKEGLIGVAESVARSAEPLLASVERYGSGDDFSIQRMELVGSAVPETGWDVGVPMARVDGDDRVWEVERTLADGEVKFRTDPEWTLDWGRGELSPETLVYKGADIPVDAGRYRVRIDVREGTVRFTPVGLL